MWAIVLRMEGEREHLAVRRDGHFYALDHPTSLSKRADTSEALARRPPANSASASLPYELPRSALITGQQWPRKWSDYSSHRVACPWVLAMSGSRSAQE